MTPSVDKLEDETRIAARLIDLICDMTVEQQLKLLNQLDKKQYKGGRSDYRRSRKIAVDYEVRNEVHKNFIQDISAAGVFIETQNPPSIGEKIKLTFSLAKSKKPVTITGKIVRTDHNGFAVDFRPNSKK
ncbi:MAG: PilZ domain-containing protein [Deltaproteobacteria bacterium]|nr:MAG: PilZ domain-containing protein [Deltaproteobacteria bacterium]